MSKAIFCLLICSPIFAAQGDTLSARILERLDRLESQNRELESEVQALRDEVARLREVALGPKEAPPLDERLAVAERRVEEHAQTKVEASQRFPIRLTGMALANAFYNSANSDGRQNPTIIPNEAGPRSAGGSIRQSVIGLNFRGPSVPGGGKVSGSLMMDLYSGSSSSLNHNLRVRTASINFDWRNTSFMVGQEKPIVSPREPNSLAQVAVSPLTNAGNLWLWQPQAKVEQRFALGERTQLRAQVGVYEMADRVAYVPDGFTGAVERARPGLQGRFELGHDLPGDARIEIAPGFHVSTSHVAGQSVPSRLISVDWFLRPAPKVEFTGMFFRGKNIAGMGALGQGFRIADGRVTPVQGLGGWAQFTWLLSRRVTFNLFGGQHDDQDSDLGYARIGKNQAYGANLMFRIAPNVVLSLENQRTWTTYLGKGTRRNSHYDVAVAYLF